MTSLAPFKSLYEPQLEHGVDLSLPDELNNLYGTLQFPVGRSYVIANFVSTIDGIVAWESPEFDGGGEVSGFNPHDRMLMGLLRATADAVIVGAGTLRTLPADYLLTAEYICPNFAAVYQQLRVAMGKPKIPLNVIVTASADLDLSKLVFQASSLIVTTLQGCDRLKKQHLPASVHVAVGEVGDDGQISAQSILAACKSYLPQSNLILLEGGPLLMGNFFKEECLDELFLTVSPQLAGRNDLEQRPSLIAGKTLAPEQPCWGTLIGVKLAGSHLFLRYSFAGTNSQS